MVMTEEDLQPARGRYGGAAQIMELGRRKGTDVAGGSIQRTVDNGASGQLSLAATDNQAVSPGYRIH